MAFLTVAGITVPVGVAGAVKKAPITIGSDSRSYAGNLRTTVRATKRCWQFTTKGLSDSSAAAIEAAVNGGAFVTCGGTSLGGGTVTCRVTIGDAQYQPIKGGFRRFLVLTLTEV